MSAYEELRQKKSVRKVQDAETPELVEILKLSFTPEEVKLLTPKPFSALSWDYNGSDISMALLVAGGCNL
jgi:hypothetical protein